MSIKIVKNEHGRYTYEIDGERIHEKSWPYIHLARRAALKHRSNPKPVIKPVKDEEIKHVIPAV